jgi:hypothetical protein
VLVGLYVALLPFPWPPLPFNIRFVDLLFPAIAWMVLRDGGSRAAVGPMTALDWCVVAVLVAPLPSLLVTPDVRASVVALVKRGYVGAVFFVFAAHFQRFDLRPVLRVLALAAAIISAACVGAAVVYLATGVVIEWLGRLMPLPYIGTVLRVLGGTEGTEMFGNYLTLCWPIACFFAWERGARSWWMAGLAAIASAMVLTFSHALGGFAVATLVAVWPLVGSPGWRAARAALAIGTIALVVLVNLMLIVTVRDVRWASDRDSSIPRAQYVYEFQRAEGANRVTVAVSYNPMSYFLLKQVAWDAFRQQPAAGVGVGTFHDVTSRAYAAGILEYPYRAIDPHSTLFGALAETGIPGGLAAAALFVAALVARPRSPEAAHVAIAIKAGLAGIAVNALNADVLNFRFLWIGLAALRALI